MNTKKTLSEQVSEVLKSRTSANKKAEALVKLGVTPYEAMCLAHSSMPSMPRSTRKRFTYTFGVEIETINCPRATFLQNASAKGLAVVDHMGCYSGCHTDIPQFKIVPDSSIEGSSPAECVTPALNGNASGFESLRKCCEALRETGASVNTSCGLHVHIGAAGLSEEAYCDVFSNYRYLEPAIDSFMAVSRRDNNSRWCKSLKHYDNLRYCETRRDVESTLAGNRYHKVNPCSYNRHRTIEFRQHQGTTNFVKISAWVKFLGKLVEWSRENRLEDFIHDINDIPFLTAAEKRYFNSRKERVTRR